MSVCVRQWVATACMTALNAMSDLLVNTKGLNVQTPCKYRRVGNLMVILYMRLLASSVALYILSFSNGY